MIDQGTWLSVPRERMEKDATDPCVTARGLANYSTFATESVLTFVGGLLHVSDISLLLAGRGWINPATPDIFFRVPTRLSVLGSAVKLCTRSQSGQQSLEKTPIDWGNRKAFWIN